MRKWLVPIAALGLCLSAHAAQTLTGVIGDDMCSGDHKRMGGSDPIKCTGECVKDMNAKYALIVGADVYILSDQKAAAKYAGKKVKVTGDIFQRTEGPHISRSLQVKSISPAK